MTSQNALLRTRKNKKIRNSLLIILRKKFLHVLYASFNPKLMS